MSDSTGKDKFKETMIKELNEVVTTMLHQTDNLKKKKKKHRNRNSEIEKQQNGKFIKELNSRF